MQRVEVGFGGLRGWAYLRELRGEDEEEVTGTDTRAAIALIDRLLIDVAGAAVHPGAAAELPAADRDRLLAAVFAAEIGRRIESTLACAACDRPFDVDFDLGSLVESLAAEPPAGLVREEDGSYRLPGGTRFRLPTGRDEVEAAAAPTADGERLLIERTVMAGESDVDPADVIAAMTAVAPILSLALEARCPECGVAQDVHFDLQRFLLQRLRAEGPRRTVEIHRLAQSYGWSFGEILRLPRSRRRFHAELIEQERAAR